MVAEIVRRKELHDVRAKRIRALDFARGHRAWDGRHAKPLRLGDYVRVCVGAYDERRAGLVRGADFIDGENRSRTNRHALAVGRDERSDLLGVFDNAVFTAVVEGRLKHRDARIGNRADGLHENILFDASRQNHQLGFL